MIYLLFRIEYLFLRHNYKSTIFKFIWYLFGIYSTL